MKKIILTQSNHKGISFINKIEYESKSDLFIKLIEVLKHLINEDYSYDYFSEKCNGLSDEEILIQEIDDSFIEGKDSYNYEIFDDETLQELYIRHIK